MKDRLNHGDSAFYLKNQLVKRIEAQLGWGEGTAWSNKDFQELSERIFRGTQKQLSVTTLKRVWGRAELIASPSVATLDILAEFAGYDSWRQFCQLNEEVLLENAQLQNPAKPKSYYRIIGMLTVLALAGVALYAFVMESKKATGMLIDASAATIEFSFQKVTVGYPNTVIFQYDIGDLPFDSLCIQQSWDNSKRIPLTTSRGLVTTTYYNPGYFLTKLMVNDRIVEEKDLYIPTEGWQGIRYGNNEEMVYLKAGQLVLDSIVTVTPDVLQEMNRTVGAWLYMANLTDDPPINSSDFRLETEFRLFQPTERSICQHIRLTVTGTKEVLGLHFSKPGCVGDLMFFLNTEMISGRNHDLSGFGLDSGEWARCEMDVRDNHLFVSLNGQEVFHHQLSSDIGNIGGVQWMFEGLGEIRSLQLSDGERTMDLMRR